MKILITGGHLTPALGLIEYIQAHHPDDECVFIGREESQPGQQSQEKKAIKKRNIRFFPFSPPREISWHPWKVVSYLGGQIVSIIYALFLLLKIKPNVICTFGGYMAPPVAIAASLLGIPLVTHEQTYVAGQANMLIGLIASKIAISYPSSQRFFPGHKTVLTGNPFRAALLAPRRELTKPSWVPATINKPILYITGGNQGSMVINSVIQQVLSVLTKSYFVIHACGNPSTYGDFVREITLTLKQLPPTQRNSYVVRNWIDEADLAWIYTHTHTAVTRAGANTVAELTLFNIPAIYIPLPFAKGNEQELNVKQLTDAKASILLPQAHLTAESLLAQLEIIKKKHPSMKKILKKYSPMDDGAPKLYQVLVKVTDATHE